MKKVLYPGSFDPITKGHMNIIKQASNLFDEIIVAVLHNSSKKNYYFDNAERVAMIQELYKDYDNVRVIASNGAAVDAALENDCIAIVRGFRSLSDYDYEVQLSEINKDLSKGQITTVCLFADKDYQFISSSMVKELFGLNKDVSKYVDSIVYTKMQKKDS